jgi:hypothetical protein
LKSGSEAMPEMDNECPPLQIKNVSTPILL